MLGWIITGPMELPATKLRPRLSGYLITNQQLHDRVARFWEIEHVTTKLPHPELDPSDVCEQQFTATTRRDTEGRFIVSLPLKNEVNELGHSLKMAKKRLFAMERKREKHPEVNEKYIDFMKDYEEKKQMTQIPQDEISTVKSVNYLPHHAVFKECSTTTKLRIVFDGSAKTSSGLSFNDVQRVGPVVQNDLL
ncbi:uncharacterized protein LOC117181153 [Belonocnema kinseyi]|uniref:uncharacterized protein LOC117181153 n=1 Tax=Belonocnema kinseyi TaxID=2817044 RepID=UPI00143D3A5F|nr:uncharacterized protein LOC117181153 [Belonocnema kinseyi]